MFELLSKKHILLANLAITALMCSSILVCTTLQDFCVVATSHVHGSGTLIYPDLYQVSVDIDVGEIIGRNNLSLGAMLGNEWKTWLNSPTLQNKSFTSNLKIFRIRDFQIQPCKFWDDQSLSGIYDWTEFDALIQTIYENGAEPLICIGRTVSDPEHPCRIPPGMNVDPVTSLPYPTSFGVYASDLVRHLKEKGWNVKYWEIWNEPSHYMFERDEQGEAVWGVFNETRLNYFTELFNITSICMRNIDPSVLIGTDASLYKDFLDYFVYHAEGVGFLSFHKYDAGGTWLHKPECYLSDEKILEKAGRIRNQKVYSPEEARRIWQETRGYYVPVICSETNLNLCWRNGTDPRIQQVIGAVWYAEALRTLILSDVTYSIYFKFASNNRDSATGGAGFGMVNKTSPHNEWYPYLVNSLLGNNLGLNDSLCQALSSNLTRLSTLCWRHGDRLNVLLIHKVKDQSTTAEIRLSGSVLDPDRRTNIYTINGSKCQLILESTVWPEASTITLNGYSVMLLSFPSTL